MTAWNIDVPLTEYYGPDPKLIQQHAAEGRSFGPHAAQMGWAPGMADRLGALLSALEATPRIAIDTETDGLNTTTLWNVDESRWDMSVPLYFSIAWGGRRAALHSSLLPYFRNLFNDPYKEWIFANAKFDTHILTNVNAHPFGKLVDTQVMHALLYEEKPHGLKYMCKHIGGWTWGDFQDQFGKINKTQSAGELIRRAEMHDFERLKEYAANDAWGTLLVYNELRKQLEGSPTDSLFRDKPPYIDTLWDLFSKIEVPYTRCLWRQERRGVKVNRQKLEDARPQAVAHLNEIETRLYHLRGARINLKSAPQIRKWLIEERKLKVLKKTSGGKTGIRLASTDANFLEYHADRGDEPCKLILEHREYSKLLGTYIDGLHKLLDPQDRIHTRYNQDVARCMPAGELVLTNRGYLPVEQVVVGDSVISHTGTPRRVTETSTHAPTPIYNVTLTNGLTLRTTGHHEYKTRNGWCRADRLDEGRPVPVVVHSLHEERWVGLKDWPSYQVSSFGRVRNKKTDNLITQRPKGAWGHLKVTLMRNGAQTRGEDKKDIAVHRLVALGFLGAPLGREVRHLDGIAWNNTLENLTYGTLTGAQEPSSACASFEETQVLSVVRGARETTYGLTVEVDHSHVTGGVVTHNTGRLSSAGPNLQNVPRPENDHWNLRGSFIPEEGHDILCFDYGQLEMRLLAAASLEQSMIDMINKGRDIHVGNAELVFGMPYSDIVKAKEKKESKGELTDYDVECLTARAAVKAIGFGIIYGMGAPKLATTLGVEVEEAEAKIEQFLRAYPAVQRFTDECIEETERTGYAFTVLGRRRNIHEILSNNRKDRSRGERLAVNTVIQGSAADVVKMAQITLDQLPLERDYGCRMLMQVHDELVFECPKEHSKKMSEEIVEVMMHPFYEDFPVVLEVDGGPGESWGAAK